MLCGLTWNNSILDKHRSVDWQVAYLPNGKDNKVRTLIGILIGLSIFFARRAKRDVISGFPEKEAVKWRPSAGTVIALVSATLLFVSAYIGSNYKQQSITMTSSFIIYE
jgi:hypothetical protein